MAFEKEPLDRLLAGHAPTEVSSRDGLLGDRLREVPPFAPEAERCTLM